jgi:hypothetical protein
LFPKELLYQEGQPEPIVAVSSEYAWVQFGEGHLQLEEAKRIILELDMKLQRMRAKNVSVDHLLDAATSAASSGFALPYHVLLMQ